MNSPRGRRCGFGYWQRCAPLAVHLGCVALALEYVQPDDDVDLGAPAIEIGVALAAPLLDPTDLPPGPDDR